MSSLTLRGGRVWDGLGATLVQRDISFDEGLVSGAAARGEGLDVSGCCVIPGLIEGHAHLCFNGRSDWRTVYDSDSPGRMLLRMAANGRRMLEAGITTVRDLGAPTDLAIDMRQAFADGIAPGPDLHVAGAPITTTGGHCWFMGGEADGELGVRKAVRERVKAGCDWIKVMATGGNMTAGTNTLRAQYTVEELRAVVEEAHRLRKPVAAHCHGTEGIRLAVAAEVDTLEHCSFTGANGIDRDDSLIDEIARKGIVVSPTISVGYRRWPDDGRKQARKRLTQRLVATGCRIAMSTDCGIPNVPHVALGDALDVVEEMTGLPPFEVLKLATSTSADLLGLPDRGALVPGRRGDAVVLDGDPLASLSALQNVRYVVQAGQVVYARPQ